MARRANPAAERDAARRRVLVHLLEGDRAHAPLSRSLADFPRALRGKQPRGAPHTAWELLEHLRLAQADLLAFGRDPEHPSPPWPAGYWPASASPPDPGAWEASVRALVKDLRALQRIARTVPDLDAPLPGTTTTWFGQLALAANHASYHLGQLFFLRRMLEATAR